MFMAELLNIHRIFRKYRKNHSTLKRKLGTYKTFLPNNKDKFWTKLLKIISHNDYLLLKEDKTFKSIKLWLFAAKNRKFSNF